MNQVQSHPQLTIQITLPADMIHRARQLNLDLSKTAVELLARFVETEEQRRLNVDIARHND